MRTRYLALGVLGLGILLVALILIRPNFAVAPERVVTSFEECVNAGYPVMESYPRQCRVPEGALFVEKVDTVTEEPTPVPTPPLADFDRAVTLKINDTKTFSDGLKLTLTEINDSRCAPDVQCIWAGELSPLFVVTGGNVGATPKEVRLGTTNNQSVTLSGYTFTLKDATPTEATIVVSKNTASIGGAGVGYVTGHVTIGPICPVERVDQPCVVPPEVYTSRSVVVYTANQTTVREKVALDTNGNYTLTLPAGTYFIQIQPAGIGEGEKKKITVVAKETQTLDFDIDTGIR